MEFEGSETSSEEGILRLSQDLCSETRGEKFFFLGSGLGLRQRYIRPLMEISGVAGLLPGAAGLLVLNAGRTVNIVLPLCPLF